MFKIISKKWLAVLTLTALIAQEIYAEDVTIIGTLQQTLQQSTKNLSTKEQKVIQLLKVQLSDEEKNLLASRVKELSSTNKDIPDSQNSIMFSETNKQLGMNNVPVLDQGSHGTCVTFAVSGAIDAILAKGDYISQLCNLQLGTYLEQHGYGYSGWNGSYAIAVINQMEQFGIVNKQQQRTIGCGGMTEYPRNNKPNSFMEPERYRQMSELIFGNRVNWFDEFSRDDPEKTLNEVKQTLNSGDRLVFAVLLPRTDLGTSGAIGKHNTWFFQDSWLLTPEVLAGVATVKAAHEMIITGYDDNAVATDNYGVKHKGLLTLRNSWGTSLGDDGEFYMSYDYFKLLTFDVTKLSPASI
jgi:C1A family cysteine protease